MYTNSADSPPPVVQFNRWRMTPFGLVSSGAASPGVAAYRSRCDRGRGGDARWWSQWSRPRSVDAPCGDTGGGVDLMVRASTGQGRIGREDPFSRLTFPARAAPGTHA